MDLQSESVSASTAFLFASYVAASSILSLMRPASLLAPLSHSFANSASRAPTITAGSCCKDVLDVLELLRQRGEALLYLTERCLYTIQDSRQIATAVIEREAEQQL